MSGSALVDLPYRAMVFARERHLLQVRKYTNDGYIIHLNEVAGLVASLAGTLESEDLQHMLALAYLHDCIEDQGVIHAELAEQFFLPVADDVLDLSDLEIGNKKARQAASCARLAAASWRVQTVKCCDILSNTANMHKHDPTYALIYNQAKLDALAVLTKAVPALRELAIGQCQANIQLLSQAGHPT